MFYFARAVPTGWAFLQETLGMSLCVIQIQGDMEPDDIQLDACSHLSAAIKEKEVKPYRMKTGGEQYLS